MTRAESYRLLVADVYELAGVSRGSSEQIASEQGQTVARWHVMSVLSDQAFTVPAIARRLGLTRQSVQRVADELVDDGVVKRSGNPDHQRSPLLALTTDGRETLRKIVIASDADRSQRLARAGVTVAELDAARETLRKLLSVL
ncbi:DNA-binding MarR family transcriptional regulator [Kribbella orskensis]|uniref:DNA-binding MarR family transcriptional regulator n=1 Tax=Kribbella orskensis TaxID=2512216 RepID=A0ABY2B9S3_9ACTN|nr:MULTISPECIES: MarR family transcriptional regulator [Kribbella]TCN32249.1 DNA-binding MarR family transcriptional regulator [Kribbella sp. VKM Ac-2500]TCO12656.1 DNA-binding MarR family transcriptional regulator [Kribbella orskensis]